MDYAIKCLGQVMGEADKCHVRHREPMKKFFDAYDEHKREHGSFKNSTHYHAKMHGRYRYMRDEAIKLIYKMKEQKQ